MRLIWIFCLGLLACDDPSEGAEDQGVQHGADIGEVADVAIQRDAVQDIAPLTDLESAEDLSLPEDLAVDAGLPHLINWEDEIRALVELRCGRCHGSPPRAGLPSLMSYEAFVENLDLIEERVLIDEDMPPTGAIPPEEQALLRAWLQAGAPRSAEQLPMDMGLDSALVDSSLGDLTIVMDVEPSIDIETAVDIEPFMDFRPIFDAEPIVDAEGIIDVEPTLDTEVIIDAEVILDAVSNPSWETFAGPLFAQSCTRCHGEGGRGDLDLRSYASFLSAGRSGDLRGGGVSAESLLIDRLRARGGRSLMPRGGPALPENVIVEVEAWINAGSPEVP